jgi:hypothetical protein
MPVVLTQKMCTVGGGSLPAEHSQISPGTSHGLGLDFFYKLGNLADVSGGWGQTLMGIKG